MGSFNLSAEHEEKLKELCISESRSKSNMIQILIIRAHNQLNQKGVKC